MANCPPSLLTKTPVFRKLTKQDQADLSLVAIPKRLSGGEFLVMQGEIWPYLLIIDHGALKTQKVSSKGKSFGALHLKEGSLFCSPSLIDGGPLPASLEADDECEVFLWHQDQILIYLKKNPAALWELCQQLVHRIRYASEVLEDLAFHPVASRVARLLLKQHQQSGENQVDRDLTLDEMATMIGTTPVMVCKILSQFADRGFIKVSRTEIEFINSEELEKMTQRN